MYPSLLHVAGVLLLWTGANAVLNCRDGNSVMQEQMECLAKFNIRVSTSRTHDVLSALKDDAATLCGYKEAEYRDVLTCAFGIGRSCLTQMSSNPDLLPRGDRVADGIVYMCRQNISAMNPGCVQTAMPTIAKCTDARAETYKRSHSNVKDEDMLCTSLQLSYDCTRDDLGVFCSEQFVRIYMTFLNDYVRPPVCGSINSAANGVPSVVTMLVATVLGLFVTF